MTFCNIVVDGISFMTNGKFVERKRQTARSLHVPEFYTEKAFLSLIKSFDQHNSEAQKLLSDIFYARHLTYQNTSIIVKMVAKLTKCRVPREVYRRKKTTLWWLTENIDLFKKALTGKTIEIKTTDSVRYQITSQDHNLIVNCYTEIPVIGQRHNFMAVVDLRKYTNTKISPQKVFIPEETSVQKPTVLQIIPDQFKEDGEITQDGEDNE